MTLSSPYMLEEKFETNKWLVVMRGNSRQLMPMTLVSNQPFTEEVSDVAKPASSSRFEFAYGCMCHFIVRIHMAQLA